MTKPAGEKFTFMKWYEENKANLSAKRKGLYANDSTYREKVKEQARAYRQRKALERAGQPKVRPSKPAGTFNLSGVCAEAGVPKDTYSRYRKLGWVPCVESGTLFNGAHVLALASLADKARETRYLKIGRDEVLAPYIKAVQLAWKTKA